MSAFDSQEVAAELREDRRKWARKAGADGLLYGNFIDFTCLICGVIEFAASSSSCCVSQLCVVCSSAIDRGDREAVLYYALQLEKVTEYIEGLSS